MFCIVLCCGNRFYCNFTCSFCFTTAVCSKYAASFRFGRKLLLLITSGNYSHTLDSIATDFFLVHVLYCATIAEDIDPSIGRFRNLVQTTVIPKKVSGVENISVMH